jgi:WD40 repeat protein
MLPMGRVRNAFLLCGALVWFSPAASAGQFFYAFSGSSLNTLTAIDIGTGFAVSTIAVTGGYSYLSGSAFDPSGAFYATGKDSTANPVVIRVNLTTGVGTLLGSLNGLVFMGMEIAGDGTEFFGSSGTTSSELYRVPPDHSGLVDIGPMGFGNFMDFAIDSYGQLYAVASPPGYPPAGTSGIYSINRSTGAGTLVATVNVPCLMGIAFDKSDNLYATENCGGPWPFYQINNLSSSNPSGATATAIGTNTGVSNLHGGDIDNFTPEPASLMLCVLGVALLAARKIHS